MGLTIGNKDMSIDITYSGFMHLRQHLANCFSKKFGEDYLAFIKGELRELNTGDYDMDDDIADFFFAADCNGKIPYKVSAKLYKLIKKDTTDFPIGYGGLHDCAQFHQFKNILHYSAQKRLVISWS